MLSSRSSGPSSIPGMMWKWISARPAGALRRGNGAGRSAGSVWASIGVRRPFDRFVDRSFGKGAANRVKTLLRRRQIAFTRGLLARQRELRRADRHLRVRELPQARDQVAPLAGPEHRLRLLAQLGVLSEQRREADVDAVRVVGQGE